MIHCQACGAANADDARFCNMCGAKIAQAGEAGGPVVDRSNDATVKPVGSGGSGADRSNDSTVTVSPGASSCGPRISTSFRCGSTSCFFRCPSFGLESFDSGTASKASWTAS